MSSEVHRTRDVLDEVEEGRHGPVNVVDDVIRPECIHWGRQDASDTVVPGRIRDRLFVGDASGSSSIPDMARSRSSTFIGDRKMSPIPARRSTSHGALQTPSWFHTPNEGERRVTKLIYEKQGKTAILTINRPQAMNAYDAETIREMGERFLAFDSDPELRVAILTGAGDKAFCAGADLKSLHGKSFGGGVQELWDDDRTFRLGQRVQLRKPVIAAVNGYCLAGGLELALACDLRIASTTASFGCPEVRNAILHGYGAMRLVQTIPFAVAMDMLLTGNRLGAQRAYDVGLVSALVSPRNSCRAPSNLPRLLRRMLRCR